MTAFFDAAGELIAGVVVDFGPTQDSPQFAPAIRKTAENLKPKRWYCLTLDIVNRTDKHKFKLLPNRWVVEWTFAWLSRYWRLSKDYESDPRISETIILLAIANLMAHRLMPG